MRYAIPLLAVWGVYWLAFFPGMVTDDALRQWAQIADGRYHDWHPVFHTWTMWLLTRPGRSFATMSLVQIVVTAGLYAAILTTLRRLGAPRWLVWSVVAWIAAAPVFAVSLLAVWKDAAFSIAVLWTIRLLLDVVERGIVSAATGIWLGISLALIALFRHNGPALVVPTLGALAWRHGRSSWRGVATAALLCGALVWLVEKPLYHAARVSQMGAKLPGQSFIHQVGALVSADTQLADDERVVLEEVLPLSAWRSAYVCDSGWPLLFGTHMRLSRRFRHELPRLWARLAMRNPAALLRHWVCVTRFVWYPRTELYIGYKRVGTMVEPNRFGIATSSLLPRAQAILSQVIDTTFTYDSLARVLIWQPATSLYVLLASLAAALWRARSAAPLVTLLPVLCNTLVWLAVPFDAQLRFQLPVVMVAPLAVCLAAADWQRLHAPLHVVQARST